MERLRKLWAGRIFGTNTGRVFLEFNSVDNPLSGMLKLSDDNFGLVTYSISGSFSEGDLLLEGDPKDRPAELQVGKISASARLDAKGNFSGEWKSEIGTGGAFELFPHVGTRVDDVPSGPEQIYSTSRTFGVLRLYRDDILELISVLRRKLPESRVVVSHIDRGAELARFSDDFEAALDRLGRLKWLKLNVQASVGGGLVKSITIDLGESFNRVSTQGPDESWVLGEAEATSSFLRGKERWLSTAIGRYRVNLNQLIAIAAIVVMPDLPLGPRAIFIGSVALLLIGASKLQDALISNFVVDFATGRPTWVAQIWPTLLSWVISATAGVASSVIYGVLQHYL